MAGTPATTLLDRRRVTYRAHSYAHRDGAAYGPEAIRELGLDPARVLKTLVAQVDGTGLAVGVLPVAHTLDLKALASAVGAKRATMAEIAAAERATGYVSGGISPLGQKRRLPIVIDLGALDFDTVYCSGGRRGLEIELAPDELVRLTGATVARIAAAR
jgi:Cys-tRNA(Pro)/Cys-tRNA(Cys) deacylase